MADLTFGRLQAEVREWSTRNFGDRATHQPLLGLVEEVGELSHSHLKQEQGIRGTPAEHEAAAKDAIGDILVYLADYTAGRGWNLQAIIEDVWGQVKQRDWKKNPATGQATDGMYRGTPFAPDPSSVASWVAERAAAQSVPGPDPA